MIVRRIAVSALLSSTLVLGGFATVASAKASTKCSNATATLHRLADAESRIVDNTTRLLHAESAALKAGRLARATYLEHQITLLQTKQTKLSVRVTALTKACPKA